jgi:hypothetical protein
MLQGPPCKKCSNSCQCLTNRRFLHFAIICCSMKKIFRPGLARCMRFITPFSGGRHKGLRPCYPDHQPALAVVPNGEAGWWEEGAIRRGCFCAVANIQRHVPRMDRPRLRPGPPAREAGGTVFMTIGHPARDVPNADVALRCEALGLSLDRAPEASAPWGHYAIAWGLRACGRSALLEFSLS